MSRDYEAELREVLEKTGQSAGITNTTDESAEHVETTSPETEHTEAEKVVVTPFSAAKLFVHHDTHPLVLDIKLMDQYGLSWFEWEPTTLWREIMDDFRTPSISDHVKSKIQALRTTHITDKAFAKWETFSVITQALNNNIPDFEIMRRPTISQLFAAVDMMTMVRNDVPFSEEIEYWCGAALLDAGVVCAPQPIAFCQDAILEIQEELGVEVDPAPVKEKYRLLLSVPAEEVELRENPVDIQVMKLIIARDYLSLRRGQMKEQLRALR